MNYSKIIFSLILAFSFSLIACEEENLCPDTLWYQDADGDGLGNPDQSISACEQPSGYVSNASDTDELVEKIISASYEKSFQEKRTSNSFSINRYLLLPASICLLALSFAMGFYSGDQRSQIAEGRGDIQSLQQEIREMKSLMVQNFLDQQENHQKLYALSLASQFDSIEGEILDRVLTTLKHDKNVNIRLAAADLLYQFAANREVQKGLVEVFPNQESPLVILELIKILKSLQPDTSQALLDEIIKQESLKDSLKEQILTTYKAI